MKRHIGNREMKTVVKHFTITVFVVAMAVFNVACGKEDGGGGSGGGTTATGVLPIGTNGPGIDHGGKVMSTGLSVYRGSQGYLEMAVSMISMGGNVANPCQYNGAGYLQGTLFVDPTTTSSFCGMERGEYELRTLNGTGNVQMGIYYGLTLEARHLSSGRRATIALNGVGVTNSCDTIRLNATSPASGKTYNFNLESHQYNSFQITHVNGHSCTSSASYWMER